jgi:hypothetical protein
MKLQIGMDSMLMLLREFKNQTGFAVCSGRASESKFENLGLRPGDVAFETIQFCRGEHSTQYLVQREDQI